MLIMILLILTFNIIHTWKQLSYMQIKTTIPVSLSNFIDTTYAMFGYLIIDKLCRCERVKKSVKLLDIYIKLERFYSLLFLFFMF